MVSCQPHQVNWNHSLSTHMIDNAWLREHGKAHDKPSINKPKLVKRCNDENLTYLNCSVLYLLGDLLAELTLRFTKFCKVRMVSCITLYTNAPTLFGHTKHEGPSILRIEICIGQYKQTLVLLKINVTFQVLKNLPSMELLHFGILSDPGSNNAFPLKIIQIEINVRCVPSS